MTAKTKTCFGPSTGFLLRSRTLVGTTPGSHDEIKAQTRDQLGNVGPRGGFTVRMKQTYVYGGKDGRVSQRDLVAKINEVDAPSFIQSWEYNDLGLPRQDPVQGRRSEARRAGASLLHRLRFAS
ncbi:MAG: hypothetical protein GY856_33470 [bacterium]|nr:hypothetical protein [bacterium]